MLESFRAEIAQSRAPWEVTYARNGNEALRILSDASFDAVVVDVELPHPDGASVLTEAKRRLPLAVRIALSGGGTSEATARAIPVTQQFLTKPWVPGSLENSVERACALRGLIADERVRAMVGLIGILPAQPQVYSALMRKLQNPDVSISELVRLLERDLALCAKIHHISNSALFGVPRHVMDLPTAVSLLGSSAILSLVLTLSVFENGVWLSAISSSTLQRHSLLTSAIARHITRDTPHEDSATIGGMLHDIGILILATKLPGHAHKVLEVIGDAPRPFHEAEQELWGVTHAELGAYLLGMWGLPYPVVEAVAYHHRPTTVKQREFDALAAVYVADCLAHEADPNAQHAHGDVPPTLDPTYLDAWGVGDRLDDWRNAAGLLAQSSAEQM